VASVADTIQQLRDMEGYLADPDVTVRMFEKYPDGVVVVDERGRIQLVNEQAELMFGYQRKELFDKSVSVLIPAALKERHDAHIAAFFNDPKPRPMGVDMILKARRKNGSEFAVEINLGPFASRHGPLAMAVIRKPRS
jgi:PAS domain S-box-containing protein